MGNCAFVDLVNVENKTEGEVRQRIQEHKRNGGTDVILNCHAGGTLYMRMGPSESFNLQDGFVEWCSKLGVRLMVLACHAGQLKGINGLGQVVCTIQTEFGLSFALFRKIVPALVTAATYGTSWTSIPTLADETNDEWIQIARQRAEIRRARTGAAMPIFSGFDDLMDDDWN